MTKHILKDILVAIPAVCAVVLAFGSGAAAAPKGEDCFDDWSVAARIVRQERLATVEELARSAGRVYGGSIVRTFLCREDGHYIYRLVIRKHGGKILQRRVNARKPF